MATKRPPAAAQEHNPKPSGTDRFGYRLGTVRARANAVLEHSKVALTLAEIVAAGKLPWPPGNHLREMVAKRHARRVMKDGRVAYILAAGNGRKHGAAKEGV